MFKTDETVRFGQILSARTLRYGKFNEYIIIITLNRVQPRVRLQVDLPADPSPLFREASLHRNQFANVGEVG